MFSFLELFFLPKAWKTTMSKEYFSWPIKAERIIWVWFSILLLRTGGNCRFSLRTSVYWTELVDIILYPNCSCIQTRVMFKLGYWENLNHKEIGSIEFKLCLQLLSLDSEISVQGVCIIHSSVPALVFFFFLHQIMPGFFFPI